MRLTTRTPSRPRSLIVGCVAAACAFLAVSSEAPGQAGPGSADALVNGIQTIRRGDTVTKVDRTGKGAVLCMRGILQAMRTVGQACHAGADPDFQQELRAALARIDRSRAPPAGAGAARAPGGTTEPEQRPGAVCGHDAEAMYEALRTAGAAGLRAQVDDLLSIPREPVMNPCL
jgi:hypothetical protein